MSRIAAKLSRLLLILLALCLPLGAVFAQENEPELSLALRRDFGYRGGDDIQGRFTLLARGPDDLVQATFYIDEQVVAELEAAPFEFTFSTGEYPLGPHTLALSAVSADGRELRSETRQVNFVTAEESWAAAGRIAIPIIAVSFGLLAIGGIVSVLMGRGRPKGFRSGQYGLAGGAVCRRCKMPFARHMLAPNLILGKLERCPHCGKWAIVPAASHADLEAAEGRWAEENERGGMQVEADSQESLQRQIDDSRFMD
jgi:hypothetical protein